MSIKLWTSCQGIFPLGMTVSPLAPGFLRIAPWSSLGREIISIPPPIPPFTTCFPCSFLSFHPPTPPQRPQRNEKTSRKVVHGPPLFSKLPLIMPTAAYPTQAFWDSFCCNVIIRLPCCSVSKVKNSILPDALDKLS